MYELALYEWQLAPEWINENWTEELLQLMFDARRKRILSRFGRQAVEPDQQLVKDKELFTVATRLGGNISVERR
jgi:hypothetical protein